jgi:hypothetical protein
VNRFLVYMDFEMNMVENILDKYCVSSFFLSAVGWLQRKVMLLSNMSIIWAKRILEHFV